MSEPRPLQLIELPTDLEHYLGDVDPLRVVATVIALEKAEDAAHYAEEAMVAAKGREAIQAEKDAAFRAEIARIHLRARSAHSNIKTYEPTDTAMSGLALELGFLLGRALGVE